MRVPIRFARRSALATLALTLALPIGAWTSNFDTLTLQPTSRLWVDGKSTIKDWSCTAGEVNAVIEAGPNAIAAVAAGEKGVRTLRLVVPANKLECGNGTMNEHMRKALKMSENPTITFKLTGYEVNKTASGPKGTLNGTLNLGGAQKTISFPAEGKVEGSALRVTGAYELKMSDYDLKAPTLMFGRIKVRDEVTVRFDLLLKG